VATLVAPAALFLAIHVLVSGTRLRGAIVARIGETPYKGLFSLASLGALVWLAMAYNRADYVELWDLGAGVRHLALVVMPFACILAVGAFTAPNPTVTGMEGALRAPDAAKGILKVTRHPFLWAVVLWALAHLLANGDLASAVLFGTLLILALVGPPLVDAKRAKSHGEDWQRYLAVTSNLPLAALLSGRARTSVAEIGRWRLAAGLGLYVVLLLVHHLLFGVSPLPL
jgi:uncharacterized membrane protein